MYSEDSFELTHDEVRALESLPREMHVGDLIEAKVMRSLRQQGHFGAASLRENRGVAAMWKIAAAVALFASGVAAGRYVLTSTEHESASITAPDSRNNDAAVSAVRNGSRPVPHETVVAEREMWL